MRQRTAPAIYIVNSANDVVMRWPADAELPPDLRDAVGELQWALRKGASAPLVRLLDSSYVVRVAPLAGGEAELCVVLVERFRLRASGKPDGDGRVQALSRIVAEAATEVPSEI